MEKISNLVHLFHIKLLNKKMNFGTVLLTTEFMKKPHFWFPLIFSKAEKKNAITNRASEFSGQYFISFNYNAEGKISNISFS